MMEPSTKVRIHSIDALRGITLLGILLVHIAGMYGYGVQDYNTSFGRMLISFLYYAFNSRCAPVFSMLFGVSFYLILKNPEYTSSKFFWRCCLLMIIGIINKILYTYDALMWYGILGMLLLLFRNMSPRKLLISFFVIFVTSSILMQYNLGDLIFPINNNNRYIAGGNMTDIISYPMACAIEDYFRVVFNGGIFVTLSYFIIGYYWAKVKIIDNIKEYVTQKRVIVMGCGYIILGILYTVTHNVFILCIFYLTGSIFMAMLFIWIYYKKTSMFAFLESYGKLGLTNYSVQNYIGVTLVTTIIIPNRISFEYAILIFIFIYILQSVFSVVWLKFFRYGPMEWAWRCLTNMRYISNRNTYKQLNN